jgi:DNA polymerase
MPKKPTLDVVRNEAKHCRACDLWKRGPQTVLGEGARNAELTLARERGMPPVARHGDPAGHAARAHVSRRHSRAGAARKK